MKVHRLEGFKGGWIVGDFDPSLHRQKHVEVAVKHYSPGMGEEAHVHLVSTEITVIIYGRARMGETVLKTGDVVVLAPGEPMPGPWEVLDATATCCVKFPSAPGDKYPVGKSGASDPAPPSDLGGFPVAGMFSGGC